MFIERGVVVDCIPGQVTVKMALKSACSGCEQKQSCGTSAVATAFADKSQLIEIKTNQQINIGQQVELGVSEQGVLASAFLVYILPLIGFFFGAFSVHLIVQIIESLDRNFVIGSFYETMQLSCGAVFAYLCLRFARYYLGASSKPLGNHDTQQDKKCAYSDEVTLLRVLPDSIPIRQINGD